MADFTLLVPFETGKSTRLLGYLKV